MAQLPLAHAIADRLRLEVRKLDEVSWHLDSKLSLYRKARASPKTGDTAWDEAAALEEAHQASVAGLQVLIDRGVTAKELLEAAHANF